MEDGTIPRPVSGPAATEVRLKAVGEEPTRSRRKPTARAPGWKGRRKSVRQWLIERLLVATGWAAIGIIALIFLFLFKEGLKAFLEIRPIHLIGTLVEDWDGNKVFSYIWQPVESGVGGGSEGKFSLLPLVAGSFLVALPATLISAVVGVGIGIYLSELAGRRVREVVKPVIELLAGIPTVVIGFLCLATLATLVQSALHTTFRLNAFVGVLGVSLVVIPIIASMTEDSLRAVPDDLREASYALGATRWETVSRVVIPAGISGMTASILLGMGRALGETMIVLMATGNAAVFTGNVFSSVRTLTATIAAEMGAVPQGSAHYQALFLVGALLFTATFFLNLMAEMVMHRMRRRLKG